VFLELFSFGGARSGKKFTPGRKGGQEPKLRSRGAVNERLVKCGKECRCRQKHVCYRA